MRTGCSAFHGVALADSGARANPLVIGRDHFLEVSVCNDFWRNIACDARNLCRDAVGHVYPWELAQTKRIRNSIRCGCEVTRRESKKQARDGDAVRMEVEGHMEREESFRGRQNFVPPGELGGFLEHGR